MVDGLTNAGADVGRVASDLVERAQLCGAGRLQPVARFAVLRKRASGKRQGRYAANQQTCEQFHRGASSVVVPPP